MEMILRKMSAFLRSITTMVWKQLPLFVLLFAFSTVPALFGGKSDVAYVRTVVSFLIPQSILLCLLICWLASLRKWIWWVIFIASNLIFLIELGCFFCQHIRFGSAIAILFLQTNLSESREFISFAIIPVLKALLTSAFIIATALFGVHYWRKGLAGKLYHRLRLDNAWIETGIGCILALSVIYSPLRLRQCLHTYRNYWARMWAMNDASCTIAYYYAIMDSVFNPEMHNLDILAKTNHEASVERSDSVPELSIVYVIGESYGRCRSSLYGYPFDTNPRMKKEMEDNSLFIFDNVIAPFSQTNQVYRQLLSTSDILSDTPFVESPLLPAVLKKGNYFVAYYDNQSVLNNSKFDFGCAYFLCNKDIQQQSIDMTNDRKQQYDIPFYDTYLPETAKPLNLTVYHIWGQHIAYDERYPADSTYFSANDYINLGYYTEKQAQAVAEYDNATRYNDQFLAKVIDGLRDKIAIMVYTPDHGDEIYDYRDHIGRELNFPVESIRLLFEVPVMIWVSDKYKQLYPEKVEMLRANVHKAIYNCDLPHTILDAAGIETKSFRPDLSLFRAGNGRTDRRIIQNGYEYDANRQQIDSFKMRYE